MHHSMKNDAVTVIGLVCRCLLNFFFFFFVIVSYLLCCDVVVMFTFVDCHSSEGLCVKDKSSQIYLYGAFPNTH